MRAKVTATLQHSNLGPTTNLGSIEFAPAPEKPSLLLVEGTLSLPNGRMLKISGNLDAGNLMMSVGVFVDEEHVSLFLSRWNGAAPYLGFRVKEVGWLHFYFEKDEPSGTRDRDATNRISH